MKYFSSDAKGFTVLELLVVLFIMTILLSIVLVSFTRGNKNTQNKSRIAEFQLVQVALEEYRAQCRVYPLKLAPEINNAYPGGPNCILELGDLTPPNINLSDFEYVPLRNRFSASGVCSAYHLSRELFEPSRYLQEDDDWGGSGEWPGCDGGGATSVNAQAGWYDIVYGVPREDL